MCVLPCLALMLQLCRHFTKQSTDKPNIDLCCMTALSRIESLPHAFEINQFSTHATSAKQKCKECCCNDVSLFAKIGVYFLFSRANLYMCLVFVIMLRHSGFDASDIIRKQIP